MSNETQSISLPQINHGIVLKREIGSLQPGEYASMDNATSIQEGSIQARLGSQRFSNSDNFAPIHTISKLSLGNGDAGDPRYLGEGSSIWRVTGPYTTYQLVTSGLALGSGRWEAAACNAGILSSTVHQFFAHPTKLLRDTGAYTPLRRWGIPPPIAPVICGLASPLSTTLTTQAGGSDQLFGQTVSSFNVVNGSYYQIIPSSMAGIQQGMLVNLTIGGVGGYVVVDATDSTSFYAWCSGIPSGTIHAWYNPVQTPTAPHADGTTYYQDFSGSVDWSFGGSASDGYSTSDNVNLELYVSNWSYVSEIRIQVFVNGSSSDYYQQSISQPATLTYDAGQATATATQIAQEEAILAASLALTRDLPVSAGLSDITPITAPSQAAAQWVEYPLIKSSFQSVGRAGSGPFNWSKVTDVRVVIITIATSGSPSLTVNVGAIYAIGGQGPDSVTVSTAQPYKWLFTNRDPLTGNEGNPGAELIPSAWVNVQNRAVQVTCWGTDNSAAGDPTLTGPNSISVYRAGGTFADSFYRFVGYAQNPGVSGGSPQKVVFTDNQPDFAIAGNQLLETDNFMPVPSSMPIPFTATIATITSLGSGNFFRITFANMPGGATDVSQFLIAGSQLTLGISNDNQEIVYVQSGTTSNVVVWVQQTHVVGEQCSAQTFPYAPCDVICVSGDAVLLAGDPNNPHQVYRSKAGEPTSFPVVNNETGNSHIQIVGSPSNPVNGLIEWNGEIVCLNLSRIYTFQIWYGAMSTPVDSGANRGMVGKHLWALVDGAIWYLSYDGVYAWAGGPSVPMTEAIRSVFDQTGTVINGYQPLDYTQLNNVHLAYYSKYFYIQYVDVTGAYQVLRCSILDKNRWERFQYSGSLDALFNENDTGRLIAGVYDNTATRSFLTQLETGSTDAWISSPTSGQAIGWNFQTGFFPNDNRDVQKLFSYIVIEIENPNDNVEIGMMYDYSTSFDPNDQFTITSGAGRRFFEFPLQQAGSPATSTGKYARVASVTMLGAATNTCKIYSIQFKYKILAPVQRGNIADWQDLGHPYDKRLYACTIEFDTGGVSQVLLLDALAGINGGNEFDSIASFTLDANRSKETFPIPDGQIAKLVRLRPQVASADMKIFDVQWKKEDYPADIVYFTEYDDCGTPYQKYLQQLILDVNTNGVTVQVQIQGDGTTLETVPVTSTLGTRAVVITLNSPLIARKFRLLVTTPLATNAMFQLWKCQYDAVPADKGLVSHTGDWLDFGSPNDKHLGVIVVEYENSGGTLVLQLDSLSGVGVTTEHDAVATFTLTGTSAGATNRIKQQFAVADSVLAAKAFRLRPVPGNVPANFKLWGWDAPKREEYPPDAIRWTEWRDFDYVYAKYAQQVILDVDTGGVAASVQVMNEAGVAQTLSVTSTFSTREQILTLSPQLLGFKYRLLITPGGGGKFQMWSWRIGFLPADKGAVTHSFDWDEIGHPYSKRLLDVTFEFDDGGAAIVMFMDILGADGVTTTLNAMSFSLQATGRGKQTFPFPVDTFATMIRFHPQTTNVTLKEWKYIFSKEDQPANVVPATDWTNEGYACEKILRGIELDMDTGGVACSVALQVDGATAQTFSVTTSSTDRVRILSPNSNIIGKLFRLIFTPGTGGKAQLYGTVYQTIKEPCARSQWDSYEQNYGIAGWKLIKQIWCEYLSAVPITFSIYRDNDQLFYQTTLPAHSHRDVERFFLPAANTGLSGSPLNKSKIYRVTIVASDGVTPFKFYRDTSRIEVKELSNDQRAAFSQKIIWEEMPIPA